MSVERLDRPLLVAFEPGLADSPGLESAVS
jgi:hypothetical protein